MPHHNYEYDHKLHLLLLGQEIETKLIRVGNHITAGKIMYPLAVLSRILEESLVFAKTEGIVSAVKNRSESS